MRHRHLAEVSTILLLALFPVSGTSSAETSDELSRPVDRSPLSLQQTYPDLAGGSVFRPNIVLIVIDDVGFGDLAVYGNPVIQTPRLDALAAGAMRFTQFYVNAPVCSPTRASILSGRYPARFGFRRPLEPSSLRGVPTDVLFLSRVLQETGYETGSFGKWHLGMPDEFLPNVRGFGYSAVRNHNGGYFDPEIVINGTETVATVGHLTTLTTDYALSWLADNDRKTFFMNLWYHSAHLPREEESEWTDLYGIPGNDGIYAGQISHLDHEIGRVIDAIEQHGIAEDTLVIVASDNGGTAAGKTATFDALTNGGLRGFKQQIFEGGIRVPMIACWPGTIPEGAVNDSVIMSFDLFPTLVEVAGGSMPENLDGTSFVDVLLNDEHVDRSSEFLFWENKDQRIYTDDHDFINFAVRKGDWKLTRDKDQNGGVPELFDLAADPFEAIDRATAFPLMVQEFTAAYETWRSTIGLFHGVPQTMFGDLAVVDDVSWTFTDGVVELEKDDRFNFHDGDLTIQLTVAPDQDGARQTLLEYPGSVLIERDELGRLSATVWGVDELDAPTSTALTSSSGLPVQASTDVAFTIIGWNQSESLVSIYIDGVLEGESLGPWRVNISTDTMHVGNDSSQTQPYSGEISDLEFHTIALGADEVRTPS